MVHLHGERDRNVANVNIYVNTHTRNPTVNNEFFLVPRILF